MKKLRQINFLFVVFTLLLVNCSRSKILDEPDYDQLYAVWYINDYRDSLAQALQPSVKRALTLKNTVDNRVFIDSVLNHLRWTRDSVSFYKLSRKAIKYAESKFDYYALASTYSDMGMYNHDLGILDSTFYYYIKAENIYKEIGDSMKMGELGFYQARVLFEKGLHIESESKVASVLQVLKGAPLSPIPLEANQLMGTCLLNQNDFEGSKKYLLEALALMQKDAKQNKILESNRLKMAKSMLYYNLSEVSYYLEDYKEAAKYASTGLSFIIPETPSLLKSVLKSGIAKAEFMEGVQSRKQIDSEYYIKQLENTFDKATILTNSYVMNKMAMTIAGLYLQDKDSIQAFNWAEKAYQLAVDRNIKVDQKNALEFLVYHQRYDNNSRVKEIITLSNDLAELDYATRNRFARIAYETEKVATENDALRNVILMVVVTSLIIILGLSVGGFIYRLRNKNKELNFIKGQQEANESIYQLILEKSSIAIDAKNIVRNKIAKDIHDGVVNSIFTIKFNLQHLQTENTTLKDTLITELQNLEKNTRDISHELISNDLFKENKFSSLIGELVALQVNQWNTQFIIKQDELVDLECLTAIEKVNIYYIIREAIHNVNKYSKASLCTISFLLEKEGVLVRIKDNGVGFELTSKSDGMGLENMKERAVFLKTDLVVFSKKDAGTEICFLIKNK
ncbi:sensor histidine kinase [Myroides odoratimimus]|uniref:sensor histidine kinase n=1 Tax=Myroides odoratimimus TaxID=76832 RepID=UPI00046A89CE|nr:histidine kinase [Myroides odoratimimus]